MSLPHLPQPPADFRARLRALAEAPPADPGAHWAALVALAGHDLSFSQIGALDAALVGAFAEPPGESAGKGVRLAVLGSATTTHLLGGIRVAGLRRGLHVTVWEGGFGQYWQALEGAELQAFGPNVVLFALDGFCLAEAARGVVDRAGEDAAVAAVLGRLRGLWERARAAFGCAVLQQTGLAVHPALMGENEHVLAGAPAGFLARVNAGLREAAGAAGVQLVAVDAAAGRDGIGAWHQKSYWYLAKQEVSPAAAGTYGDLVGRVLGALWGRSSKCLVLDLDNTVWGGVIGDDGMEGIVLGQGSALGEAYAAFQGYVRGLAGRGVILAVCSKNDEANALEPFLGHPEMVLQRGDIACFVANWEDKATNLRRIAETLNIGLDSLVFVDDNPMERGLVRRELPMVAVPEVGDDPVGFIEALAGGGYFESVGVTAEDRDRTALYAGNAAREALRGEVTDLEGYLRGLEMRLVWRRFDLVGMGRIVQLVNKSNQFNLTTRRYSEEDVRGVMGDDRAFGLQLRLVDRFGDNGMIGVVVGRAVGDGVVEIETWLMSCRVLGRGVEATTLNLVAEQARGLGGRRLVGVYRPTKKNGMVRDHYAKLGFRVVEVGEDGGSRAELELAGFSGIPTFIELSEG